MRALSILASAALTGSAAIACAQPPRPAPPPEPREPSRVRVVEPDASCTTPEPGRIECRRVGGGGIGIGIGPRMDSAMMKRAALGLNLSGTGTMRDTLGVFVSSVTPNGPAEKAGVIEGDRIVSINGVDLRVSRADVEDSYASGLASRRLQREVAKLTPGSVATLRVWSGGRIRDVQVTTGRAYDLMRARTGFSVGTGPGVYIYRDGSEFPMMAPMAPMAPMTPFPPMEMNAFPRLERMRELMPQMRKMELRAVPRINGEHGMIWVGPRGGSLLPGKIYRLRDSTDRPSLLQKRKAATEKKVKAKADSAKKSRD